MKDLLNDLTAHKTLDKKQSSQVLRELTSGKANPAQVAAFLTVFLMRSITVEELEGFRDAMLDQCLAVDLEGYNTIDLCGTGGDGKDTFNVSTCAAFVVAGAGQAVAKHGNFKVSSVCGSSNVLQYLGYEFTNDKNALLRSMEQANICILHAPLFHPAMKNVAHIRQALGVRTFFNMLGPLVNPARPKNQLTGVFSLELARLYAYLFQKTETQYSILHALDGYDECSLTCDTKMYSNSGEYLLRPEDLGFEKIKAQTIVGGKDIPENGKIFISILEGKGRAEQEAVVLANAGLALHTARPNETLQSCVEVARTSLRSGKALAALNTMLNPKRRMLFSHRFSEQLPQL